MIVIVAAVLLVALIGVGSAVYHLTREQHEWDRERKRELEDFDE